jgi:sugar phosphate isomerase/epimerase
MSFETPNHACWTRRQVLKTAGLLTVGTACPTASFSWAGPSDSAPAPQRPSIMQVGILMGVFPRPNLEAQLDAVKANGLECVQVGMECVGLASMPDATIPNEAIDRLRREAAARKIAIVALQGTFNMCHPDADERALGLRRLRVLAEACPRMGVPMIHICTGTRNRGSIWSGHPDNDTPEAWRDMTVCVREATRIAKQSGVVLGFEPEVNNVVDSAEKARRLLDDIGSPHLKVAIDCANVFHAGQLAHMSEVLDHVFELIGKDIVMAHAKDVDHDGDGGNLPAGHGKLDYDRYLSLLHKSGFKGPLLLHSLSESQVPGCVKFLRDKLDKVAG